MSVLLIAEQHDGVLLSALYRCVTAARALSSTVDLLIMADDAEALAHSATQINGLTRILISEAAHYADTSPENKAAFVCALVAANKAYTHILTPATSMGKSFMPRVAATLDVAQISDVLHILTEDTFVRPLYAGSVLATVRSNDKIKVLTLRSSAFAAAERGDANAVIERIPALADRQKSQCVERTLRRTTRPALEDARTIVAGGRGLGSRENYQALLEPLADALNAAVGASRAAVDAGFVSNDQQIGQSGKIVAPALYIAVGLSGAIQHLAGIKDSHTIVAINKDPAAPICQIADYTLQGDLFTLVPELIAALNAE